MLRTLQGFGYASTVGEVKGIRPLSVPQICMESPVVHVMHTVILIQCSDPEISTVAGQCDRSSPIIMHMVIDQNAVCSSSHRQDAKIR